MSLFIFEAKDNLGLVRAVDTRKVSIQVNSNEDLRKARVGQLVAIALPSALSEWLIGIIGKVVKIPILDEGNDSSVEMADDVTTQPNESILNTVQVTLVGSVTLNSASVSHFKRSILQVPEIDALCYILKESNLQAFMNLLSIEGSSDHSLELGKYTIDESASAYLDGNKLFQRHAALLGSTGSGKSWAVASILEHAAKLPSSNLIVFDLHGEYSELTYAKQLKVPGPDDLGKSNESLLFLPYWLLNAEELVAWFIDKSEFTAHNQVMVFQDAVIKQKLKTLDEGKKEDVLKAFTLDSPVPFSINEVMTELLNLNTQMVPGVSKDKQGPYFGQFDRLLLRLRSKTTDRRYGFLFQSPEEENTYEAMSVMVSRLMNFVGANTKIKVIDFSEVPTDVLPVIIGLVARIIYQVQFWTNRDKRKPLALVCDEAHLYLPKKDGRNPIEQRAIENFEKIAKEGRKYGVALLIVSQRPSDVSSTILSQCNNIISLRLTNGDDQATVKRLMPESLEGLLDMLPMLDIGEALIVGDSVLLPSRIKLTPPIEKPLSTTIDFWDEWRKPPEQPDFVKAIESMRKQSRT